jgi:hypothetical protein
MRNNKIQAHRIVNMLIYVCIKLLHHVDVQYFAANDILTFLQYKNIDISFLFSFGNRCLLSVKYYILKWMKICISKLQTYISILTLIEIVYHVYILFSEYALHWFFVCQCFMESSMVIKLNIITKYKIKSRKSEGFLGCSI